jgi:hypothetical protein
VAGDRVVAVTSASAIWLAVACVARLLDARRRITTKFSRQAAGAEFVILLATMSVATNMRVVHASPPEGSHEVRANTRETATSGANAVYLEVDGVAVSDQAQNQS